MGTPLPNYCSQRSLYLQINPAFPRANNLAPSVNPYISGNYTQFDLNMRRKAEILKYSSNQVSTQTNNLTKNQRFAQLVKNPMNGKARCSNALILTPSSSCDVPGPVVDLYYDPAVTLYNYSTNTRAYAVYVPTPTALWNLQIQSNISFINQTGGDVFYMQITPQIDRPTYSYNITLPVGVIINGQAMDSFSRVVTLQNAVIDVYYGQEIYTTLSLDGNTDLGLTFDCSGQPYGISFSATQYLGNLYFNLVDLPTQSGYVYSFVATFSWLVEYRNNIFNGWIQDTITEVAGLVNMSPNTNTQIRCNISETSGVNYVNTGFGFSNI
jgi:hypothetical protein